MHRRSSQVAVAAVALILGLLVVVQLRAQSAAGGLTALSSQELTVLVANLNDRNDQLRGEVASLERDLVATTEARERGALSADELRADLRRIRVYAGLDAVTGPGVVVSVSGPIDGTGVEDLVNELRNAGAEAISTEGVRLVAGLVATGQAGSVVVGDEALGDPFEISAIGASDKLTGSLTRSGGVIAQLAATQPEVTVTVTPVERLEFGATERDLIPDQGRPLL